MPRRLPFERVITAAALLVTAKANGDGAKVGARSRRIIAAYPYRDEAGQLLYEVVRCTPKDFRQRRPDGNGGWIWKMASAASSIVLTSSRARRPRSSSREKKTRIRLAALGLPATTNSGGAGKWTDQHTEQLKAAGVKQVNILPDNDAAGHAHAEAVASSCLTARLAVRIVELPGLPPKRNVSDWLDAGHSAAELTQLVQSAPFVVRVPGPDPSRTDLLHNGSPWAAARSARDSASAANWLELQEETGRVNDL